MARSKYSLAKALEYFVLGMALEFQESCEFLGDEAPPTPVVQQHSGFCDDAIMLEPGNNSAYEAA